MKNLFDDFMDELRRRQEAEANPGRPSGHDGGAEPDASDVSDVSDDSDTVDAGSEGNPAASEKDAGVHADDTPPEHAASDEEAPQADEEPEPIRAGPRTAPGGRGAGSGGRPPRRRGPGGPDDGSGFGSRAASAGRRVAMAVVIVAIVAFVALAGFGVDLWTDAIWFTSVGYDAVFWTRIGTEALLFAGGLAVALAFLFGNVWLARRLSPPPEASGKGTLRGFFDRIGEAARNADRSGAWTGGRPGGPDRDDRPFGQWGGFPGGGPRRPGQPRPVSLEAEDLPDLAPIASIAIGAVAIIFALGIAGAASSGWETFLLYQHQVPFAATGPAVTDPVFGQDIGFFLFQLPFLRLGQSLLNGLLLGGIVVSLGRYLVGAMRGSLVFTTPVRVHLGVLVGLYLLSVAFGYQLDKYELVYSARGVATGVSYTDANAQFFALDALTVIAASRPPSWSVGRSPG